jgi:hypothetical protein
MTTQEKIEVVQDLADEFDGRVHESYSGRGMYGRTCYGVSVDGNATDVIEEAAARGLRGACTDNLGLGTIIYWPSVPGKGN